MEQDKSQDWRYLPPRELASIGPAEYITERMYQYRKWYDDSASVAKRRFLFMKAVSVMGAAVVPVLVNLDFRFQQLATTLIGLVVVVFVSLETVFHYGDQWKNYRSTEQFIQAEYFYFTTGDGVYKGLKSDQAFIRLVERVEGAISSENSSTLKVMTVASKSDHGAPTSSGA